MMMMTYFVDDNDDDERICVENSWESKYDGVSENTYRYKWCTRFRSTHYKRRTRFESELPDSIFVQKSAQYLHKILNVCIKVCIKTRPKKRVNATKLMSGQKRLTTTQQRPFHAKKYPFLQKKWINKFMQCFNFQRILYFKPFFTQMDTLSKGADVCSCL